MSGRGRGDRGGRGGGGDRGGGRGGGYDRGGGRGGGRDMGGMTRRFDNMNVGDRGGGRGGGGFRGGSGGAPRGRTQVNFKPRDPRCSKDIRAEVFTEEFGNSQLKWNDSFKEDGDNILPVRKGDSGVVNHDRTVIIRLNHFETKITLPATIFMYRVDMERIKGAEKEPGPSTKPEQEKKKKKGKGGRGGGGGGDRGGAGDGPEVPMLPAWLRKTVLKHLMLNSPFGFGFITDFSASIYASRRLEDSGVALDNILVPGGPAIGPEEEGTTFKVMISRTTERIDRANLKYDINNMRGAPATQELVDLERVYSTFIRCLNLNAYTPMRRADLINFGAEPHRLGGGIVSYPGYNIMLPMANGWKKFVNIEIANMATYISGPVYNILANLFGCTVDECRDVTQWSRDDFEKATNLLRSCKITYSPGPGRTFSKVVVGVCPKSVSETFFNINDRPTSVYKYFRDTGRQLRDKNGPCLELKGGNSPKVPVELCTLKAGQSFNRKLDEDQVTKMAEVARKNPGELQRAIQRAITDLHLRSPGGLAADFGFRLVSEKMHEVQARVLVAPELCYGKKTGSTDDKRACIIPENGEWDIYGMDFEFFKQYNITKYGVLDLAGAQRDIQDLTDGLRNKAATRGINLPQPTRVSSLGLRDDPGSLTENVNALVKELKVFKTQLAYVPEDAEDSKVTAAKKNMNFVLVIIPRKGSALYTHVKQAAELHVGILTQCIAKKNVGRGARNFESILGNILLKINSKLNKVNHVVLPNSNSKLKDSFKMFDYPIMVMGADVTHPPPGSGSNKKNAKGKFVEIPGPSYAAITASIDRTCMPYMMHVQAQAKAKKGAAEVIQGLDDIIFSFIKKYYNRSGYLPIKIIMFRDGVGEGQFQEVLRTEMSAIRRACTRVWGDMPESLRQEINMKYQKYEPKITFITVQKRHKTRFFVNSHNERENAPPGTVVDVDIVHAVENDFFLLSHKGLLGTSRPTRYHVLWDDSDFKLNEIQTLAYYLCYMFVRCNKAVKIPAPTYYAHWAAKRCEVLAKGWGDEIQYEEIANISSSHDDPDVLQARIMLDIVTRLNQGLSRRLGRGPQGQPGHVFAETFPFHFC